MTIIYDQWGRPYSQPVTSAPEMPKGKGTAENVFNKEQMKQMAEDYEKFKQIQEKNEFMKEAFDKLDAEDKKMFKDFEDFKANFHKVLNENINLKGELEAVKGMENDLATLKAAIAEKEKALADMEKK